MKKYIAEAIGTFAIVFCGTGAIIIDEQTGGMITNIGVALSFGLIIMLMVYLFANTSGAHFNPAVSIAFVIFGKLPLNKLPYYLISQLCGAVLASFILKFLFPLNKGLGTTISRVSTMQSLVLELILTFLLMVVILQIVHMKKQNNLLAGSIIGSVVMIEAILAGPVCGASMNPARSLAPALVSYHLTSIWIYIIAPVSGAALAVLFWRHKSKIFAIRK